MLTKWILGLVREWWDMWGDTVSGLFTWWCILAWLFVFFNALNPEVNNTTRLMNEVIAPVSFLTGCIPSLIYLGCRICIRAYALYLDYQYFVANGGKRKRDDV